MNPLEDLLQFLDRLDEAKISYRLSRIRDAVMVDISVPGEQWEVEFFADGEIDVERFVSKGGVISARTPENQDLLDHLVVLWGYGPAEEGHSEEENVPRQYRAVYDGLYDEMLAILMRHDPMDCGAARQGEGGEPPENYVMVIAIVLARIRFDNMFEEARLDIYEALSAWRKRGFELGPIEQYDSLARDIWEAWNRWRAQRVSAPALEE